MNLNTFSLRTFLIKLATTCLLFALLLLHIYSFREFFVDDAYISLQYAKRYLMGLGLTWTDGHPVEGYSNFLWVIFIILLGKCGITPVIAAKTIGLLFTVGAMGGLVLFFIFRSTVSALVAGVSFAVAGPVAAWAMGGLEQGLVVGLLCFAWLPLLSAWRSDKYPGHLALLCSGFFLGLLCLTRPDSPLFVVAIIPFLWFDRRRRGVVPIISFLLFPALCWCGLLVFRYLYYGEFVPNTAYVKVAFSPHYLRIGLWYLGRGLALIAPVVLLAAGAVYIALRRNYRTREVLCLLCSLLLWMLYVLMIGGDVNPPSRHFVVIILGAAFLAGIWAEWAFLTFKARDKRDASLALCGLLVFYLFVHTLDAENLNARRAVTWLREERIVATHLSRAFEPDDPLVAVVQAGWPAYWTGFRLIDMLGLNDYHIARNPPEDFGGGWIGHELGDPDYLFDREPDIIVMCGHLGRERACFQPSVRMQAQPRFYDEYVLLYFLVRDSEGDLMVRLWVRRLSTRLGLRSTTEKGGSVYVPAYFFSTSAENATVIEPDGGLTTRLKAGVHRLQIPPALGVDVILAPPGYSVERDDSGQLALKADIAEDKEIEDITLTTSELISSK